MIERANATGHTEQGPMGSIHEGTLSQSANTTKHSLGEEPKQEKILRRDAELNGGTNDDEARHA